MALVLYISIFYVVNYFLPHIQNYLFTGAPQFLQNFPPVIFVPHFEQNITLFCGASVCAGCRSSATVFSSTFSCKDFSVDIASSVTVLAVSLTAVLSERGSFAVSVVLLTGVSIDESVCVYLTVSPLFSKPIYSAYPKPRIIKNIG